MGIQFQITHTHQRSRAGILTFPGGSEVQTPAFMPVGTQATVKTLETGDLEQLGVEMMLCNAYHLYLRPGQEIVRAAGGLHGFMDWKGGIITDSGGFQVFSMSDLRKLTPDGVQFTSHLDGSRHLFTPETNMQLQHDLGADIIMALDVCVAYPSPALEVQDAVERTTQWARRCLEAHERLGGPQALFGIVQGGVFHEARKQSARELTAMPFPGFAIGGLSVGEGPILMNEILALLDPLLPEAKPRYLMGVGTPEDLWDGISRGVDLFDCAMPTRIARNGTLYTSRGRLQMRNAALARDFTSPDPACGCPLCRRYTRAYLRHLFKTHELTALRLSTLHNLTFMLNLCRSIREAIRTGTFEQTRADFMRQYQAGEMP